jgi:hypothetical protein
MMHSRRVSQEEKRKADELRTKREAERKQKLKDEERDKWWLGAEVMYGTRDERAAEGLDGQSTVITKVRRTARLMTSDGTHQTPSIDG